MKCYKCNTSNKSTASFCRNCGFDLSYRPVCEECKNVLNKKDQFCIHCGLKNPLYNPYQRTRQPNQPGNALLIVLALFPPTCMILGIITRIKKGRGDLALLNFFFYPIFWVIDMVSIWSYYEIRYWI